MVRPWPLTGRDADLGQVTEALRPGSPGIVVAGGAGVGKTRLAREALAARGTRDSRGGSVVWVQGSAAVRPLPLGALAGVLDIAPGDGAATISRALEQLSRQPGLLLVVDDAHLLDEHSAIVLHRVVARGLAPALVTLRSGEPAPGPVTLLWKDDLLPRLDLRPLDLPETTSLVAQVLGGAVESASARRLWTLTGGSPLFLRHLLAGEVAAGRFAPASGIWRWTSEPAISAQLADVLQHEIGGLTAGAQDVVDVLALAEPLPVVTLAALTSRADLEEAENRGLVVTDGLVARLGHPLYGEVRRAAMGVLRARRLRGEVAQTLDPAADPVPRAVLTLDSDLPPDPALFLRAAEASTGMFDLPLAERLARAAAATGEPAPRLVHAAALSWLSRGDEAEAILAELAESPVDPSMRAWAHLHRTGNLLWTLARPDQARLALAAAEATGAMPLHVAGMSLALDAAVGDVAPVLARGPGLLRTVLPDDLARILVASAVSAAAAVSGRRDLLDEAATVGGLTSARVPTGIPGFGLADLQVLGHRLAGTPATARDQAAWMLAVSADLPGPARLMGLVVAGHAALAGGRVGEALTWLREAWAGLADSGHEFRFRCRTLLATALSQAGESAQAGPLLDGITVSHHPAYRLYVPDDHLALAWGAAAAGETTQALGHAVAAARVAREMGAPAFEILAWQTATQLGGSHVALPRLSELAGLTPRAAVARAHALAWTGSDAARLREVADDWAELGDLVAAGDAAAQAADLHRRQGLHGSALAAAAAAEKWAARSGARTPALTAALHPLPLTAREREVVDLAARGLSNRDIAQRLTVSVRTVEGHLYRAGLKLGVSERSAFAQVLGVE